MTFRKSAAIFAASVFGLSAAPANAALTLFQQFTGNYGLSTDGAGSTASNYTVNAFVPVGATVVGAYLYQSTSLIVGNQPITFNGTSVTFGPQSYNTSSGSAQLGSARADVTSLVSSVINGGAGGTYSFNIGEGNSAHTDGTALVVVYSLASLATQTIAILDGFSAVGGDTTTLSLGAPTGPGFAAEMRLGIGFSFPNQSSNVSVNGTQITSVAGGFDDGQGANGALITVGGNDDPFSALNPAYADDHERYNIAPYVANGSTSITVRTNNPSGDDNIFLAAFVVSGNAVVNPPSGVPEPATWAMMMLGFGAMGGVLRRRKTDVRVRYA